MVKRGLIIGRFQPFHKGHLYVVKHVLEEVDEVVIVVGSAQYSHRLDNPFTVGERLLMIRQALQEAQIPLSKCWLIPVPDLHVHMLWVSQVIGYTPKFQIIYTNEPLTKRLFEEAGFNVKPIPFHKRKIYSATEIRNRMLNGKNWKTLVPRAVARNIEKISGVKRIQELAKTDKV
jgi:nicotinamide-nucleotide adenylyltransferase